MSRCSFRYAGIDKEFGQRRERSQNNKRASTRSHLQSFLLMAVHLGSFPS